MVEIPGPGVVWCGPLISIPTTNGDALYTVYGWCCFACSCCLLIPCCHLAATTAMWTLKPRSGAWPSSHPQLRHSRRCSTSQEQPFTRHSLTLSHTLSTHRVCVCVCVAALYPSISPSGVGLPVDTSTAELSGGCPRKLGARCQEQHQLHGICIANALGAMCADA